MSYEFDIFNQKATSPDKKPYAAMQISKLGKLADLTQTMLTGDYTDGGKVGQPNVLMFGPFSS